MEHILKQLNCTGRIGDRKPGIPKQSGGFMLDDIRWIREMKKGDGRALEKIFEKYHRKLLALALHLCRDRAQAEDVVQDVFVNFAGKIDEIHITSSLKSYLAASIVNRSRNMFRSTMERTESLSDDNTEIDPSPGPELATFHAEQSERIRGALAQIPSAQREVILLHLQWGMTFRVISKTLSERQNTVQSRYRYGIEKLRPLLAEGGNHEQ